MVKPIAHKNVFFVYTCSNVVDDDVWWWLLLLLLTEDYDIIVELVYLSLFNHQQRLINIISSYDICYMLG